MKYAFLLYDDLTGAPEWDSPEMAAEMQQWFAFTEELGTAGAMLGGEALQGTDTSTCVQVRDGSTVTSDGPFAETKEVLGGFYLVEADDLDAAIKWAEKIPSVGHGTVEIRPIMEIPEQG
jgi:hypothetical protein